MIVEDETYVLDGLKQEINWASMNIEVAFAYSDSLQALHMLEKQKIDILFTDIEMANMSGLELIKKALILQPELEIVIISGHGSFEYAQRAIELGVFEYLLKPVTVNKIRNVFIKLTKKLGTRWKEEIRSIEQSESILKQNVVYDILYGIQNEQTEREIRAQEKFDCFQIAVIKIDENTMKETDDPKHALKNAWKVFRQKKEESLNYVTFMLENKEIFVLFSLYMDETRGCVEEFLVNKKKEIINELEYTVSIGVSKYYKKLENSFYNLEDARKALEWRFYVGYNQIIYFDKIRISSENDLTFLNQKRLTFLKELENRNYKKVIAELDCLEATLQQSVQLDVEQVRRFGIEFCSMLRYIYERDSSLNDRKCKMHSEIIAKLNETGTLKEMFESMKSIYNEIIFEEGENGQSRHKAVEQTLRYIKENVNANISLAKTAQKVGLSPNYLGKIFKEEMKIGFNDYLLQYRMEMAKKLLNSGKYKIYEISSMVGYKNPNYFSKVFTEYMKGICPSDYLKG